MIKKAFLGIALLVITSIVIIIGAFEIPFNEKTKEKNGKINESFEKKTLFRDAIPAFVQIPGSLPFTSAVKPHIRHVGCPSIRQEELTARERQEGAVSPDSVIRRLQGQALSCQRLL